MDEHIARRALSANVTDSRREARAQHHAIQSQPDGDDGLDWFKKREEMRAAASQSKAMQESIAQVEEAAGRRRLQRKIRDEVEERSKTKASLQMTRGEVEEIADALLANYDQERKKDLSKHTKEYWEAELEGVYAQINTLYEENWDRIKSMEPRFLEGMSVREVVRPPVLGRRHYEQVSSSYAPCVQCQIRRLKCSHTILEGWNQPDVTKACKRCQRNCELCVRDGGPGIRPESLEESKMTQEELEEWERQQEQRLAQEMEERSGTRIKFTRGTMRVIDKQNFALPRWDAGSGTRRWQDFLGETSWDKREDLSRGFQEERVEEKGALDGEAGDAGPRSDAIGESDRSGSESESEWGSQARSDDGEDALSVAARRSKQMKAERET